MPEDLKNSDTKGEQEFSEELEKLLADSREKLISEMTEEDVKQFHLNLEKLRGNIEDLKNKIPKLSVIVLFLIIISIVSVIKFSVLFTPLIVLIYAISHYNLAKLIIKQKINNLLMAEMEIMKELILKKTCQ